MYTKIAFSCVYFEENNQVILEEFSTLTPDIERMRDLLKEQKYQMVAMESTGIYWIPVWRILEGHLI